MTELGNTLKAAREAKGLSLDDLQHLTKIQKRYLIGIEKGNYDMMPGKFYVRAFIKQYAEAVELEPEEIFEQFKNEIPSVREEELPEQLSRVQSKKTISPAQSKFLDALPKVLVAIFIIGVAILIYVLVTKFVGQPDNNNSGANNGDAIVEIDDPSNAKEQPTEDENNKKDEDDNKEADNKENEDTSDNKQEISVVESSGSDTTYELKNTDSFKVKVASKGESWVEIRNGSGKVLYSGILKENESEEYDFTDEEKVELVIGRTLDAEIYVNDELVDYEIPPSEKVKQDITITYIKAE